MSKKKQPAKTTQKPQRETDIAHVGNLAKVALDPKRELDSEQIKEQVSDLNPEEAAIFLRIMELTLKRRRIQLLGYVCAMFAVLIGMITALYIWSQRDPGQFIGYVFFMPVAGGALSIWLFGRWSNRIK